MAILSKYLGFAGGEVGCGEVGCGMWGVGCRVWGVGCGDNK